jgi:phosphoenolpyruvate synthase/pyruvate phosphate dikinase
VVRRRIRNLVRTGIGFPAAGTRSAPDAAPEAATYGRNMTIGVDDLDTREHGAGSAVPAASLTRSIADLSRSDVPYAGGKGANLGELTAAGMPVPDGFVVGAPTYAMYVEKTGLRDGIAERLRDLDVDDTAALETAAGDIRAMIETQAVPTAIDRSIVDAYAGMGSGQWRPAVAVRSSATAEDTASASFAGMNETFLNVCSESTVVDAVRRCWASLFGARTIFYRAKRGLDQAGMDIAVVVQRQLASTRAGVMFTVDPATGRDDQPGHRGSVRPRRGRSNDHSRTFRCHSPASCHGGRA